jgi:hypothetical protein
LDHSTLASISLPFWHCIHKWIVVAINGYTTPKITAFKRIVAINGNMFPFMATI